MTFKLEIRLGDDAMQTGRHAGIALVKNCR